MLLAVPYGTFEPSFVQSLAFFMVYDAQRGGHVVREGGYLQYGTTNLPHGRNQIVKQFLAGGWDWLWFVDTDQVFAPDTLERMLASADAKERPILGSLIFSFDVNDYQKLKPTLWTISNDLQPARLQQVPPPGVHPFLTGTGCVLIHRSVFEGVAAYPVPGSTKTYGETAWPWFAYSEWTNNDGEPDVFGEDLTFMLKATAAGFVAHVDTRIEVGHRKAFTADLAAYRAEQAGIAAHEANEHLPTFVVVPVKGNHELTDRLVADLDDQGGYTKVFILDNGADTDPYRTDRAGVEVIPSAGRNIHEMWNEGIKRALDEAPDCNIAILNNDLLIGSDFLAGLVKMLRCDPRIGAVCPNYDGRTFEHPFQPVQGIAANRYDGTGGLAGFAFMVRGDLFSAGLPLFDERLTWWFGDNDFCLNLEQHGLAYGIAIDTTVEHIGGGSQSTVHDADFEAAIAKDRKTFMEKWAS